MPYTMPVVCVSCGWRDENETQESSSAIGIRHLGECEARDPALHVPLWSIGWPWYWAPEEEQGKFTFEVGWMPTPPYVKYAPPRLQSGMDAKEYYFFPPATNRLIYGVDSRSIG